jgi:hypothetical protein
LHFADADAQDFADTNAIVALVWASDTTLTNYTIAAHFEWDLLTNEDGAAGPVVSSAAVLHPSLTEETVDALTAAGIAASGYIEAAGTTAAGALSAAARAVPVLADIPPVVFSF